MVEAAGVRRFCYEDPEHAIYLDQRWLDLAPAYADSVTIDRSPGLNLGHWNLHQRTITREGDRWHADEEPLLSLNFAGVYLNVLPPDPSPMTRADFGLEPGTFYCYLAFDLWSVSERKNPFGAIDAFRLAVKTSPARLGLVIHVSSASKDPLPSQRGERFECDDSCGSAVTR